jgi:hypothetical protein
MGLGVDVTESGRGRDRVRVWTQPLWVRDKAPSPTLLDPATNHKPSRIAYQPNPLGPDNAFAHLGLSTTQRPPTLGPDKPEA